MGLDKGTVVFFWDKLNESAKTDFLVSILDADQPEEFSQVVDAVGGASALGKAISSKLYAHVVKEGAKPASALVQRGFEFLMGVGLPMEVELSQSGHGHTTSFAPITGFLRNFAYNSYSSFNSSPRPAKWDGMLKILGAATNVYPGVRVHMDYRPASGKEYGQWDYGQFNLKRSKSSYGAVAAQPADVVDSPSILLVALQHGLPQMKAWLMERAQEVGQLNALEAIAVSECGDFDLVMEYLPQAPEVPFVCLPRLHKTLAPEQFDRVLELLRDYPLSLGGFGVSANGDPSSFASRLSELDVKSFAFCVDAGLVKVAPDGDLACKILDRAVSSGNTALVAHLLDEGMSVHQVSGREGLSLLHRARTPEVARLLLERGASIQAVIAVNSRSYSYREDLPKNNGMPVAFYWANTVGDEVGPQMLALAQEYGADLSERFSGRTMLQHIGLKNLQTKAALKSLQASGGIVSAMGKEQEEGAAGDSSPRRRGGFAL